MLQLTARPGRKKTNLINKSDLISWELVEFDCGELISRRVISAREVNELQNKKETEPYQQVRLAPDKSVNP